MILDKTLEELRSEAIASDGNPSKQKTMYFDVPIVARDTSAIGWTLGGSGVLLPDNDPVVAAEMVNRVLTDEALKEKILKNQRTRLQDFDNQKVKARFLQIIEKIIREN